jgi:hypothetical protein
MSHSSRQLEESAHSSIIFINSSENKGGLECFVFATVSKPDIGYLLNYYHNLETFSALDVYIQAFLPSTVNLGEPSASRSGLFPVR